MNCRYCAVPMLGVVLLSLAACGPSQRSAAGAATEPHGPSRIDVTFVDRAATSSLTATRLAELAQTKTKSPDVRAMAAGMIQTYDDVDRKLAALTQAKGIDLSPVADPRYEEQYHQLGSLNGADFERAFIHSQLQDQTIAIQAFQTEADSGTDPQLRELAAQTLPTLLQNLQAAQQLSVGR